MLGVGKNMNVKKVRGRDSDEASEMLRAHSLTQLALKVMQMLREKTQSQPSRSVMVGKQHRQGNPKIGLGPKLMNKFTR